MKSAIPRLKKALSLLAFGACALSVHAQTVLFEDNFETDTTADWEVLNESGNGTPDYSAQFNFNYVTNTFDFNGVEGTIPLAPNSGEGETRGVKLSVNKDATADVSAVNIFPKGESFTGNYALKFDMWINYNGGRNGGTGSTEFGIFGINHTGTVPSWDIIGAGGDGVWFAVTGEGGAARDYRSYENDGTLVIERQGLDAGLIGSNDLEEVMVDRFPLGDYETPGAPGKKWVQVEVAQRDGNLTWKVNGYVLAERPNSSPFTEGNIMLGTMDILPSIAVPGEDNFVIFDNVRVVSLPETTLPTVTIAVADDTAAEPGADTASLTVTRSGEDFTNPLVVKYRVSGTAESGTDVETPSGSVTIPAGSGEATIEITAKDDNRGEPNETVVVTLLGSEEYELRTSLDLTYVIKGQVNIMDDGDTSTINLTVVDAHAYEKNVGDHAVLRVTRSGDISQALTVNLQLTGSAVGGTDYETVPSTVTLDPEVESTDIVIRPSDNAAIDANRTVIVTLQAGTGYALGANTTGTVTIRNDDIEAGASVLFSENFQTDVSENWNVNIHSPENNSAEFGFDYSQVGIPPAPNTTDGSTKGLKLQANNGAVATFTGLSVSPKDLNLEGDYRIRFDMWNNYVGPLPLGGAGSTMFFTAGLGTEGTVAQFPGTSIEGVMFAASSDGQTTIDYRIYTATGAPLGGATGAYAAGNTDAARNSSDPYYSVFGGRTAPEEQLNLYPTQTGVTSVGSLGMAWHEVVITKVGTVATWFVDNVRLGTVDLADKEIGDNIFVGYFDFNTGQSGDHDMSFGLVDNLRVEQLSTVTTPPEIEITATSLATGSITIRFTATSGAAGDFDLVSATEVAGPYTEVTSTVTQVSPGVFEATVAANDPHRFFQVRYQP